MPIVNAIQSSGGQEATSGLPGNSSHWNVALLPSIGTVCCERQQSVGAVCFQRGRQHLGWDLWQGWGPPGPWMQRGLGMNPGFQTRRCLRMRSWRRKADQAIGDWYMKNEDFTLWLHLEIWPLPLPTFKRRAGVQCWYILDLEYIPSFQKWLVSLLADVFHSSCSCSTL